MNRDEVVRLAREAGIHFDCWTHPMSVVLKFAELVAAKEREACAKACDASHMGDNNREDMEARRCAEAICARQEAA